MGMVARKVIERVRHIDVGELWIHDADKAKLMIVINVFLYSFPEKLTTNFCHTFHTSPTSDCQNFSSSLDIRSQEGKKAQSEVTCHFGVS